MASRRRSRWLFVPVGLVAVGLVLWAVLHKPPAPAPHKPATPVTVATVTLRDMPATLTALGAAQAWRSDTIVAQVTGKLISVDFREGGDVRAGQVLARIDPAPFKAALLQAQGALQRDEAVLAEARLDLKRYQTLGAQDSISRQQVDAQTALVRQDEGVVMIDQGAVATARVNLGWCDIVSPIAGRAGVRLIDPGNVVTAGAAGGIVVINENAPIAVTFTVPEGDFQRLSQLSGGFRRPLQVAALSQETGAPMGEGEVSIADNRVDPSTGTVTLKARFANADHRLWPGQFVNVRLTLQTLRGAATIPVSAVNQGPKGPFAYVVDARGKAQMRPIVVSATEGDTAVIGQGLAAGETVVTDGQLTLKPGAQVKVRGAPHGGQRPS